MLKTVSLTKTLPSARLPLTRRDPGVEPNICTSCSGYSGNTVVICGVERAAGAVDGQRVLILSQNPADNANQDFPVLLSQQTVDKWVARGLGIGETFGGNTPVPGDVHRGQQLHQPARGIEAEEANSLICHGPINNKYFSIS